MGAPAALRAVRATATRLTIVALLATCHVGEEEPQICVDRETIDSSDPCNFCQCVDGESWAYLDYLACSIGPGDGANVLCLEQWVGDIDTVTPGIQPLCRVTATEMLGSGGSRDFIAPECVRSAAGYTWPADDVDFCWFARTDLLHVGDPIDDLSPDCQAKRTGELAIEIEALRRPGTAAETNDFSVWCVPPEPSCPGGAVYGDPCEPATPQPCVEPGALPSCPDDECTSRWCTVGNDAACATIEGATCIQYWWDGAAPEGREQVGICALADTGPCKGRRGVECDAH